MKCALIETSGKVIKLKWIKDKTSPDEQIYLRKGKSKNRISHQFLEEFCDNGGYIETTDIAFFEKIVGKGNLKTLNVNEVPVIVSDADIDTTVTSSTFESVATNQKPLSLNKPKIKLPRVFNTGKTDEEKLIDINVNKLKKARFHELAILLLKKLGRADQKDLSILLNAEHSTISRYLSQQYKGSIGLYYIQSMEILLTLSELQLNQLYQQIKNGEHNITSQEYINIYKQLEVDLNASTAFVAKLLGVKKNIYDTLNGKKSPPAFTVIPLIVLSKINGAQEQTYLFQILSDNFTKLGGRF